MSDVVDQLWAVARSGGHVDADALARSVEGAAGAALDYRTRLLIRDSLNALRAHWGPARFQPWLNGSARRDDLRRICDDPSVRGAPADEGFPTLANRMVNPIDVNTVKQLLRELSAHVTQPTRLIIGGSVAMLLAGHLARHTDDIDIVDELPAGVRLQPELLESLATRYGLRLAHFQSHYLPDGWELRVRSIDVMGHVQVFAVDPYDVFVGKLFSTREKDRDDLRTVAPRLDRTKVIERLQGSAGTLRAEPRLHDAAKRNWFIVFGEPLPA